MSWPQCCEFDIEIKNKLFDKDEGAWLIVAFVKISHFGAILFWFFETYVHDWNFLC